MAKYYFIFIFIYFFFFRRAEISKFLPWRHDLLTSRRGYMSPMVHCQTAYRYRPIDHMPVSGSSISVENESKRKRENRRWHRDTFNLFAMMDIFSFTYLYVSYYMDMCLLVCFISRKVCLLLYTRTLGYITYRKSLK